MEKAANYLRLLRIHQWAKNTFIFLPAFFALKLLNGQLIQNLLLTFFAFSLLASSVYIFNDMLDINEDRLHPKKSKRPLASGAVKKNEGVVLIIILLSLSSFLFGFVINNLAVTIIAALYLAQNLLYTVKLKHISIVDVMIISLGFVFRIMIGGEVTDTVLSHWIILMTFVLALFLALAKRRDDVVNFLETGNKSRKNIQGYNLEFLNTSITIMATVVVVCYLMYCTSEEVIERFGDKIYLTSFFVILGVIRYLQLTFVWHISGSPTKVLLKNLFLQLIIVGWIASFFLIIYLKL